MADTMQIGVDLDTSGVAQGSEQMVAALQATVTRMGRLQDEFAASLEKSEERIGRSTRNAAAAMQRQWQTALAPITHAFDSAISGMILGTMTFQQAMAKMGQSIVTAFVNRVVHEIVDQWIVGELAKTAATQAGNAERGASDVAAGAASAATGAATAKEGVVQHAWSAAAAVYDDVAQIPYVGWVLAPPAAAAAAAAVLAFGGNIPGLALGAWNLPGDMVARLHAGETVLPADFASGFRAAVAGAGSPAGGDTYAITIQAIDTQTGAQFLKNNARAIASALNGQMRNFNPALRPS